MNNPLTRWIGKANRILGEGARTFKPEELADSHFIGDARIDVPNQIQDMLVCSACVEECPGDVNVMAFSQLCVGTTMQGLIQIWCLRHNRNITLFSKAT